MRTRYLALAIILTLFSAAAIRADETVTYRSARANAAVAPVVTSPQQINAVPHPISTNKPQRKYHKDPMVRPDLKYPVETYDPANPRFILDRAAELADERHRRICTLQELCRHQQYRLGSAGSARRRWT